jgi:hypothetical protein
MLVNDPLDRIKVVRLGQTDTIPKTKHSVRGIVNGLVLISEGYLPIPAIIPPILPYAM